MKARYPVSLYTFLWQEIEYFYDVPLQIYLYLVIHQMMIDRCTLFLGNENVKNQFLNLGIYCRTYLAMARMKTETSQTLPLELSAYTRVVYRRA